MKVGLIGLGHVGSALAGSLLRAGYGLTVNDLRQDTAEPLIALGARWAKSAGAVAEASNVVITSLPTPEACEAVALSENGFLEGLSSGSAWIETSTLHPSDILRFGQEALKRGIDLIEAPLSGGVHRARSGRVTMLVGGDTAIVERYRPLLAAVSSNVLFIGPLGKAAEIKIITNMMMFINSIGMGEGLMLAKRAGIDLRVAYNALCSTVGGSWVLENEAQLVLSGSYNIEYTMALAAKDLHFAYELGRDYGVPLEMAALTQQIYARARAQYGDEAWSTMVVKLLEDTLGEELRAPGFPQVLTDLADDAV